MVGWEQGGDSGPWTRSTEWNERVGVERGTERGQTRERLRPPADPTLRYSTASSQPSHPYVSQSTGLSLLRPHWNAQKE